MLICSFNVFSSIQNRADSQFDTMMITEVLDYVPYWREQLREYKKKKTESVSSSTFVPVLNNDFNFLSQPQQQQQQPQQQQQQPLASAPVVDLSTMSSETLANMSSAIEQETQRLQKEIHQQLLTLQSSAPIEPMDTNSTSSLSTPTSAVLLSSQSSSSTADSLMTVSSTRYFKQPTADTTAVTAGTVLSAFQSTTQQQQQQQAPMTFSFTSNQSSQAQQPLLSQTSTFTFGARANVDAIVEQSLMEQIIPFSETDKDTLLKLPNKECKWFTTMMKMRDVDSQ
jgi:hypothetical protein